MGIKKRESLSKGLPSQDDSLYRVTELIQQSRAKYLLVIEKLCPHCLMSLRENVLPYFLDSSWGHERRVKAKWFNVRTFLEISPDSSAISSLDPEHYNTKLAHSLINWACEFNVNEPWILDSALSTLTFWSRNAQIKRQMGWHISGIATSDSATLILCINPRDSNRETRSEANNRMRKQANLQIKKYLNDLDYLIELSEGLKSNPQKAEYGIRALVMRQVLRIGPAGIAKAFQKEYDQKLSDRSVTLMPISNSLIVPSEEAVKQFIGDVASLLNVRVSPMRERSQNSSDVKGI